MKKLSLLLFAVALFATQFASGTVNARNGISVTTASTINGKTPNSAINGLTLTSGGDAEVDLWLSRISAASGTLAVDSESIARAFMAQLRTKTYNSKIIYILPLLGSNLAAARVPLRDTLGVGIAGNTGFVDADFSQSTGLANATEATKHLDSLIKPSQLGISNNGGIGWWENNWGNGSGVQPMGTYDNAGSNRYVLDLRSSVQAFRWGSPANSTGPSTTVSNADYYGQRSSSTSRAIYKDGSQIGTTNTTSDGASGASERNIWIHGVNNDTPPTWKGRCAVAYLTDGTLTPTEVADLHTLLHDYLIVPTGR